MLKEAKKLGKEIDETAYEFGQTLDKGSKKIADEIDEVVNLF